MGRLLIIRKGKGRETEMKRQIKDLFIIAALTLLVSGCGTQITPEKEVDNANSSDQESEEEKEPELPKEQEEMEEPANHDSRAKDVRIALITDVSAVMDNGFNQAALRGIQTYADGAGVSYSCYNVEEDGPDSYEETVLSAIQDNARLIVCAGSHFEQAVGTLQNNYDDIYFLVLDGVPRDSSGNEDVIAPNVHCITYREEEAGYLVGYMSVLEGYRRFGFIGGEQLPSVQRYGYGYLQGIDDAAGLLGAADDIEVEYWYADSFSPNEQIETISGEWYQEGTEIIFACGGSIYQSVLSSAEADDGMLIGADVDQSDISGRFLTSAMKGIDSSVIIALDDFFASGKKWPSDLAGNVVSYGAREKCINLPVQNNAWRFQTATMEEYLQILARLKSGDIQISVDTDTLPETIVAVIYYDQLEENDS